LKGMKEMRWAHGPPAPLCIALLLSLCAVGVLPASSSSRFKREPPKEHTNEDKSEEAAAKEKPPAEVFFHQPDPPRLPMVPPLKTMRHPYITPEYPEFHGTGATQIVAMTPYTSTPNLLRPDVPPVAIAGVERLLEGRADDREKQLLDPNNPFLPPTQRLYLHLLRRFNSYYQRHLLPSRPALLKTHLFLSRNFWPALNHFPSAGRPDWGPDAPYKGFPPAQARYDYAPKLPISIRPPFHPWFGGGTVPFTYAFGRHIGAPRPGLQNPGVLTQLPFTGVKDPAKEDEHGGALGGDPHLPPSPGGVIGSPVGFLGYPAGAAFGMGGVLFGPAFTSLYGSLPQTAMAYGALDGRHGMVYPVLKPGTTVGEEVHDHIVE